MIEVEPEVDALRAEVARLTARVAELEAGDAFTHGELIENRARLDYALSAAGIVAWDWDPVTGHVLHSTDVNQNLDARVGSRAEFAKMIHPEDAARTAAAFEAAFRGGTEYRQEYRIVTPAGTRWIMSAGRTFDSPDGRRRMSGIMMDVTARHDADAQLRDAGEQLRLAVEAAQLGTWSVDRTTDIVTISDQAATFYGITGDRSFSRFDLHAMVPLEDLEPIRDHIEQALQRGEPYAVEHRVVRRDGSTIWLLMSGRGTYDEQGALIGQIGVMQDITARRESEARQQLLMRELNHRVKNTLAIVQALALQSQRGAPSPRDFAIAFDGRLRALSTAHSLLTSQSWQGAEIAEVVHGALKPFDASGLRIAVDGCRVRLAASVALNLSLALHELATNATKYGALSVELGTVALSWRSELDELVVDWRERGGPAVVEPETRGFGARLIENGVTREVGGTATLGFEPDGLACTIRLPLSAKVRLL